MLRGITPELPRGALVRVEGANGGIAGPPPDGADPPVEPFAAPKSDDM